MNRRKLEAENAMLRAEIGVMLQWQFEFLQALRERRDLDVAETGKVRITRIGCGR